MDLPIDLPVTPMLAKAVTAVPEPDAVEGGLAYEPKWDGFRCIVLRDGDEVELASRGAKPLTRYFPEVVASVRATFPQRCAVDAEVIVRAGRGGAERLSWEALTARIHPAASRVALLSKETPAELVCFDLLAEGSTAYLDEPFSIRRAALERLMQDVRAPSIHLTQVSTDPEVARDWLERFEGAGLDGVVAKPLAGAYTPGKRTMLKVKHKRTADAVVYGYRVHKSGRGVGSLLLGLYTDGGQLVGVGGIAAFSDKQRLALVDELAPLVERDDAGEVVHAETDRSRFSASKDVSFVPLRPEKVVEVAFDQMEGHRFRHTVTFLRWRPDREPRSCLLDQIDRAPAYDLGEVLAR
ncbi:MAG TPA: ATP-dependent DNA ligase [Intrasporangium sp.]|uniref:ATP-dependent DNA ligase n=1 Tax=Intrasporangium sp. TaxID=1925024 RepID=UPI002D774CBC|nr:ATP-dependent DNA ligase [Intrasporangium sp.]HET7396983.1 ATP-dependent DNA ligase [Intrasporangium sp.]